MPIFDPFGQKTELELCGCFDRPPRNNPYDHPFYPWLPREPPSYYQGYKVSFKLGFHPDKHV